MRQWFVAETVRYCQDEAALSVAPLGMEAYVPCIIRRRRRGVHVVEEEEPRFGTYIFVRFDRDDNEWVSLINDVGQNSRYFKRFLSDVDPLDPFKRKRPTPVPDKAIEVIMAYNPPQIGQPEPVVFQPGQRVTCIISPGVRKDAVFVGYNGNTPMVETWIFGRDHIVPVTLAQLEPLDLDTVQA